MHQTFVAEALPVPMHKMPPPFGLVFVYLLKIAGRKHGSETRTKPLSDSRRFYAWPERFKSIKQMLSEPFLGPVMLIRR
jgi:hypothetical protein